MQTIDYALGRTPEEFDRVRAQARLWETDTARLLDRLGLAPGARCLDAGCGPGETMRLMAERTGPTGTVTGLDIDPVTCAVTESALHEQGYRTCRARVHDLTGALPIPDGPYDLVYARLLLFHLPQRVEVLRRLWASVAPGGHLLLQDYDVGAVAAQPPLALLDEMIGVVLEAFGAAGCDVHAGTRLPHLMIEAGAGAPDGTDVAGRLLPITAAAPILESVYRSLLPVAYAHGLTSLDRAEASLAALHRETAADPGRYVRLPLLGGAWKKRPAQ
ncbi:class I SAM-dependent methyltransferase [Actinoplanes sp. NPDC051851]|uniref:class I SAM-dependent methyltransferase n=1 Tax=Actinoplanes sp. NPDC051851 TaxID=3154753 RepID=UPI00343752DB